MPKASFFFYDLETSGLSASDSRIMQFAGQRTDFNFCPIGQPVNLLVRLDDDTLPSPRAILTTKITPQKTRTDGIPERELAHFLTEQVFTPETIVVGFNSIRFDDKFIQHLFWRNFFPAYDWQWRDGRSRWDLLDVVRMTRALRPDGINWPFTPDGKPTNRLELMTKANQIAHESAHDALSDVNALIGVTALIKRVQPKLFAFLFRLRDKREVAKLVNLKHPTPFVYTSGRYGSDHLFTTVAYPVATAKNGSLLVFDLRNNLDALLAERPSDDQRPLRQVLFPAFKEFAANRCPAVAPLGVLEQNDCWARLELSRQLIGQNLQSLLIHPEIIQQITKEYQTEAFTKTVEEPEASFYDNFLSDLDMPRLNAVRAASAADLANFHPHFADPRLPELLIHYKAKNFPTALTADERQAWQQYRTARLTRQAAPFLSELQAAQADPQTQTDPNRAFLLEELYLWYQSLQESE